MSGTSDLHREAMRHLDDAFAARQRNAADEAARFLRLALQSEREAADVLASDLALEPTRSVLHRSAATIAIEAGEFDSAERLICRALAGHPPSDIAEELRDLLEQAYFHRHLSLRGLELAADEFQMSITGDEVGYGMARPDAFLGRVSSVEKLLYRTAERQLKKAYRSHGSVSRGFKEQLEVYLSVPRAASFAVSFRVGRTTQLKFEGLSLAEGIVDEVLYCFELFNRANEKELRSRIPDLSYYTNFVGLARAIAPDGRGVKLVGFTALRNGEKKEVALTIEQNKVPIEMLAASAVQDGAEPRTVRVTGRLAFANALRVTRNLIKISPREGKPLTVVVPEGLMDDIVRPLWDTEVTLTAVREGKDLKLLEINSAPAA